VLDEDLMNRVPLEVGYRVYQIGKIIQLLKVVTRMDTSDIGALGR
jgi:hypothetical protein